jgi:ribonuclease HI
MNEPFELFTDASDSGIGGILKQKNKIIEIYSKKINETQKRYTTMEKELFAIIQSLQHFKTYLYNSSVTIYTDNANLIYNTPAYNNRTQRWKLILFEYQHEIKHLKGANNLGSDYLSRNFSINPSKKIKQI